MPRRYVPFEGQSARNKNKIIRLYRESHFDGGESSSFDDSISVQETIHSEGLYSDGRALEEDDTVSEQDNVNSYQVEMQCFGDSDDENESIFEIEVRPVDSDDEPIACLIEDDDVAEDVNRADDELMYPEAQLTLHENMVVTLAISLRDNMSQVQLNNMLNYGALQRPQNDKTRVTVYKFNKYFADRAFPIIRHFYCSMCFDKIEDENTVCLDCPEGTKQNYFIEVPIKKQLQEMFKRPGFLEKLQYRFSREVQNEDNLEDIYDGESYKRNTEAGGFLNDGENISAISLTWYTDGMAIFKSSKFSIWPFYLLINELPFRERARKENVLLALLWFGESKPNPNLFMHPLYESLKELNDGIEVQIPQTNLPRIVKGIVICGTCDLPAKALFMNMKQYNGKYGCQKCKQKGEYLVNDKVLVYPYEELRLRTDEETEIQAVQALDCGKPVCGVKGPTLLTAMVERNVKALAVDAMHCVFEGVVKNLVNFWFSKKFSDHPSSLIRHLDRVDKRLLSLTPPSFVQRYIRSIKHHLSYWKAHELKAWFFYYSISCVSDIMKTKYFKHYILLLQGVSLLYRSSISAEDVNIAERALQKFVRKFEKLYNKKHMSNNVHQLLHLAENVRQFGPLWVTACFPQEDLNGRLKSLVHGSKSAQLQISSALSKFVTLTTLKSELRPDSPAAFFCESLDYKQGRMKLHRVSESVYISGKFVIGQYVTVHGDVISHVNISQVMVEDGGEYSCTAENRAGKVTHSARLNVYGLPYIRFIPKVTAVAGETLRLKCPVAGYPIEEVKWERAGRELPDNIRHKVMPDGTLVVSSVQKEVDTGTYTCWARNKQGHSARRSGDVTVIVPPKISPFTADRDLHLGERTTLTCSVTRGDLPLSISWLKDGRSMGLSERVTVTNVDQFNSILMIESLSPDHNGNYSCVARNLAAEVSHTQQLVVHVPPIIEPFTFQEGLSEGMRTRTVCGVAAGDPPLTISWLKDGQSLVPLSPKLASGTNVSQLDSYSSLLSITNLTAEHSGDFTCVAANPAAEVRYTAKLQVKVPPHWLVEPTDVSVERNRHIALHCQASGVPPPAIVWKKATGSKSGEYEELRERTHTKLLNNGTLVLQHVKEDREGFYLCQASNGIGTGIGKVVQLKVNSSPYFAPAARPVTVKKGDTATLHCEVHGDKPVTVTWLKGGKIELNPSTNYRVTVKQEVTPDGVVAQLQISSSEALDSGAYFCRASNLYGRDQQLVQLLVQEPPHPPNNLETAMVAPRSINVKWQHKSQDTSEVSKYILQYKEGDSGMWQQQELSGPPLPYAALIDELKPATKYIVRVIAEGPAGRSTSSAELVVRTEPERPAGPPINIAARPLSHSEILVTWSPPLPELRHGEVQGFNVGYRESTSGSPSFNFTSVIGDGEEGGGELRLMGLRAYTRYTIVVQAYNQVGSGPLSEALPTQTLEDVPSKPPEDVRCAALSSQSLQISWQPPPSAYSNGIIQGYKLNYEPVLADMWRGIDEMEMRKTSALTIVLSGLRRYTNYSIQVVAFTRVGDGITTRTTYCHTDEDVPGSPADIKVVVSSPQALFISWLPPLEPNGIITKYNLYTRIVDGREELNHGKRVLPATNTFFETSGLQQRVEYQFWVTGSTRVGEGQSSRVAAELPTNRVPARITSFGGHIVKPWRGSVTLSCNAVGNPTREWYKGNSEQVHTDSARNLQVLSTGELMLSSLQTQDGGNYTCQVENAEGIDRLHYSLLVQVPPTAPMLYVTSSTSSSVLLHWKPGYNGGAPLTGYTLHYRTTQGNLHELPLARRATNNELKGLLCGNMYHLHLTSHNKIGSSPSSPVLSVRTQGQPPGIPPAATFLSPNSTTLALRLHAWPDNGCPIDDFVIQYRPMSEFHWTLVSNSVKMARRFVVTNLSPSTVYQLKVEAHNVAGSNHAEFTFITLTKDGEPPPPELTERGIATALPFYADVKVMLPLMIAALALLAAVATIVVRWKTRHLGDRRPPMKETQENQQNAEAQRERYYATIHKVALQQAAASGNDKIPETAEDISPYATFQLSEGGGGSLAGLGGLGGLGGAPEASNVGLHSNNTLLHSFMYHEHAMTEGCASPPPVATSMKSVSSRRRQQRKQHTPGDVDSDESESDPDQLTRSRTESSNQLDAGKLKHIRAVSDFFYHPTSSTSSDISPMCEQKSLTRRGRSRWHVPSRSSLRMAPMSVAETAFGGQANVLSRPAGERGERPELSEAECDIDSLKKPKLGQRASTLWSKPGAQNNPSSDYSIAV